MFNLVINLNKDDIIRSYKNGDSSLTIGRKYGINPKTIIKYLRIWNISINQQGKLACKCNVHYFKNIDTEFKAYWLGFIAADGCIFENRLQFCLANNFKTGYYHEWLHLKKLREAIQGNQAITFNDKSCFMKITSEQMIMDLKALGINERKTFTITPPILKETLMPNFWRGYFDGNGCIDYGQSNSMKPYPRITVGGNLQMMLGFKNFCLKIERKISGSVHFNRESYTFSTSCFFALTILDELYRNASVYLERKYKGYLEAKDSYH